MWLNEECYTIDENNYHYKEINIIQIVCSINIIQIFSSVMKINLHISLEYLRNWFFNTLIPLTKYPIILKLYLLLQEYMFDV